MKKRVLSIILMMSITMTGLFGCGKTEIKDADNEVAKASVPLKDSTDYDVTEPVTFEFWHGMEEDLINPMVEKFNKSQDLITVNPVYVGNYAAIKEQVAAAQAAGEGLPGLCLINYPQLLTYAESNVAEPLNAYMEAANYENLFYEGFTSPLAVGDNLYAFPWGPSTTVVYYNKDLIKQSGRDDFPATWAELKEWAPEFHEKTGKTAIEVMGTDFNYVNTLLLNTGVDPISDGTKCVMDDERVITWINEMQQLIQAGAAEWINTGASTETDLKTKFINGEVCSMVFTSTYYDKAIAAADFEVGVALVPENANNNSTTSGATLFIPAQNEQNVKNGAFEFLQYMTNDENAKNFALKTAYLPTKKSLLDSEEEINEFLALYPEMKIIYENMDTIVSKNPSPYFTKALTAICENLTLIFNAGEDRDAVVKKMVEEVDYILSGN